MTSCLSGRRCTGIPYGVPKSPVREALAQGQDVILKIDVQGGDNIRRLVPGAVYVFLAPPDMAELEQRLTQRRTESTEALKGEAGDGGEGDGRGREV